jgi:hypothetical protein
MSDPCIDPNLVCGAPDFESSRLADALCDACDSLLSRLATGERPGEQRTKRQYSENRFAHQHKCAGCPGFITVLKSFKSTWSITSEIRISVETESQRYRTNPVPISTRGILTLWIKERTPKDGDGRKRREWSVLPLPPSPGLSDTAQIFGRTWNPAHFDPELLRRWMVGCDKNHLEKCRQALVARPNHRILLIDTKQFRLVDSAGVENYAALSYVWGKQTFLKTTSANLERLRKQGSLRPTSVEGRWAPCPHQLVSCLRTLLEVLR